jgi:hypothetical protein
VQAEAAYGIRVTAVVSLRELVAFVRSRGGMGGVGDETLAAIEAYRDEYGVK